MFDSEPGSYRFVQHDRELGNTHHRGTLIYAAFVPNKAAGVQKYIVRGELHTRRGVSRTGRDKVSVLALKFYPSQYGRLDDRYSRLTNAYHIPQLLVTLLAVAKDILARQPDLSLCFMGVPRVAVEESKIEHYEANSRYRVYAGLVARKIGTRAFNHYDVSQISSYILLNRASRLTVPEISAMMEETYPDLTRWLTEGES